MFRHPGTARDRQTPFDVAVVIPTTLRPELARAVGSVFAQVFEGRIQLLIGIDVATGDPALLDRLAAECPEHIALTICDLGYSTSVRHGGLYPNRYSGALRTILSYAANSRYVAYLDDDNWWAPEHLASLLAAIGEAGWTWSARWFVEAGTGETICLDDWESVGPDAGVFLEKFGGFVDPSSLLLDKFAAHDILPFWSLSPFEDGSGEDRLVFASLKGALEGKPTGRATSYYTINPADPMQSVRLQQMRERGVVLPAARRAGIRSLAEIVAAWPEAPDSKTAPAPPDFLLEELIGRLKPRELAVLGSAETARGLAERARRQCASAITLAIAGGSAPSVGLRPLPAGRDLDWLAGQGVAIDLAYLGTMPTEAAITVRSRIAWRLLRAGGILIVDAPPTAPIAAAIERFAAEMAASLLPAALDAQHYWILEKP